MRKAGFSPWENKIARDVDSPLEGPVRSEPVSEIGLTRVILDDNKQVSAGIKLAQTQLWPASEDSWAVINA